MSPKLVFRRLFKTALFRAFICRLIAAYIRFVYYTSRRRIEINPAARPYAYGEKPALFAFWHGRLLMIPMINLPRRKMNILISTHRDGELIARTLRHFGVGAIRGSTTRGGVQAAKSAVAALRKGENVSVTPDGPRGPAMRVQPGLLAIAQMAGVPVVPVTYAGSRHRRMRSWDRFMVALPFGSLYFKVGAPMTGATKEALEKELGRLTEEADLAVGVAHRSNAM